MFVADSLRDNFLQLPHRVQSEVLSISQLLALEVSREGRVELDVLSSIRRNNPLGSSDVIILLTSIQKGIQIPVADRAQFVLIGSKHRSNPVLYRIELLLGAWDVTRNSIGVVVVSEIFELPLTLIYVSSIVRGWIEIVCYLKVSCLYWNDVGQDLVVLYVLVDSEHMGKCEQSSALPDELCSFVDQRLESCRGAFDVSMLDRYFYCKAILVDRDSESRPDPALLLHAVLLQLLCVACS